MDKKQTDLLNRAQVKRATAMHREVQALHSHKRALRVVRQGTYIAHKPPVNTLQKVAGDRLASAQCAKGVRLSDSITVDGVTCKLNR